MEARSIALGTVLVFTGILLFAGVAGAAEIKVMISGGFSAAHQELAREFERTTGNKIVTIFGPSMGNTPEAIPNRMQRGEPVDVVIMVGYALDNLVKQGKVIADSRVDLARSGVGVAVRAGAPKPDISSVEALKQTLLRAKSIAYSDSASGVYVSTKLFPRLGIADQVKDKAKMIPAEPVGLVVARGEAEIGFQQISELRPIKGIDLVGPLPPEVQNMTIFSAGVAANSPEPQAAKAYLKFISSPAAVPIINQTGLEAMASGGGKK